MLVITGICRPSQEIGYFLLPVKRQCHNKNAHPEKDARGFIVCKVTVGCTVVDFLALNIPASGIRPTGADNWGTIGPKKQAGQKTGRLNLGAVGTIRQCFDKT
jgi:hypothetical protein